MLTFKPAKLNANQAKKLAKAGITSETIESISSRMGGPSWDNLALEYFHGANTILLSHIYQIHGPEKSCKSTLALYFLRRYFAALGAESHLIETESKISPQLVKAIFQPTLEQIEQGLELNLQIDQQGILENVQTILTVKAHAMCEYLVKEAKKPKAERSPSMLGISLDSFKAKSKHTVENIRKLGHTERAFPLETLLWASYLSSYKEVSRRLPITLFVINHSSVSKNSQGFNVYDVGGGVALKYYETYQWRVESVGQQLNKSVVATNLKMTMERNSMAISKRRIFPTVVYKSPDLEPGMVKVDFSTATANLLTGDDIHRSELAKAGVCDTKASTKPGLYNDAVLGLKLVPIEEIEQAIYSDPEKIKKFREIEGISTFNTLDELWDNGWFFNDLGVTSAAYAGLVEKQKTLLDDVDAVEEKLEENLDGE